MVPRMIVEESDIPADQTIAEYKLQRPKPIKRRLGSVVLQFVKGVLR